MFEKLLKTMEDQQFTKNEINHAFSIILRAFDEINYMREKKEHLSFSLKQMENFIINYDMININILINNENTLVEYSELKKIVNAIYNFFEKNYPINYNYRLIDPIYFSLFFYDVLDKIVEVKYDIVNISDFKLLRYNSKPVSMEKSESYMALMDEKINSIYTPFKSNHIIDSDRDRLNNTLNSILKNGYPHFERLVTLYNDDFFIRDGQHRVAVLKYLYGNIDVKVVRFYLKDNYFYS